MHNAIVCYFSILTCYCIVWLRLTFTNKRIWWWWWWWWWWWTQL